MDYEHVAADFLRALRGKRSQAAFCRRLGYKSNVAYTWEARRGFPTAARALQVARRMGVDLQASLRQFYRTPPVWLDTVDVATPEGVASFLEDLRGNTSIAELARITGRNRFAVSRWIKGEAEPKLPEFLQLVECSSLRLVDLLETFVDPRTMPSIRERWETLNVARRLAYDAPWTQAVLRALEMDEYRALRRVPRGWIARRIGITLEEEQRCLELLLRAGQVRLVGEKWEIVEVFALDTRQDPEAALRLRVWWGNVALGRLQRVRRGMMYNLFGVSARDLERLRDLQKAYFNEVRAIVSQSEPVERVVLATVQLLDLGEEGPPDSGQN